MTNHEKKYLLKGKGKHRKFFVLIEEIATYCNELLLYKDLNTLYKYFSVILL